VQARVTDLQEVPLIIVFTEAEGFNGQSWTIQCKILEQELLGQLHVDEDLAPNVAENGQPCMTSLV
jgi:hypothetical protein